MKSELNHFTSVHMKERRSMRSELWMWLVMFTTCVFYLHRMSTVVYISESVYWCWGELHAYCFVAPVGAAWSLTNESVEAATLWKALARYSSVACSLSLLEAALITTRITCMNLWPHCQLSSYSVVGNRFFTWKNAWNKRKMFMWRLISAPTSLHLLASNKILCCLNCRCVGELRY